MKELLLVVLFCTILTSTEEVILSSIPNHLIECYQNGGPILSAPRRLDVFISLIRRLELNSRLDMRLFSTALLRSLRLDGIEEAANTVTSASVLPFRASAFQFHKYKLLMELFLPSQSDVLNVDEGLNNIEKCLLHKMLSSTVRPWERGDESLVCPLTAQNRQSMAQSSSRIYSRCPIEVGVIKTDWGTISPGTLVAALASSLEAQRVSISDILTANIFKGEISQALLDSAIDDWHVNNEAFDIDRQDNDSADISNIWVATLAGDLAEVVVNQGPRVGASSQRMLVGSNNRWNDTMLPRNYYIFPPNGTLPNWHFTDAEILAGIDGDLAEVVVNQGPRVGASSQRMLVGSNNRWNDTMLPRNYYIFPPNGTLPNWHFTDAEILAGIDGLILANYLPKWVGQKRSLRLSQVIEMYYSNEGVSFEPSVRACNRHALFSRIVNSSQLLGETSRFSHVLSLQQITVYIPKEEMLRFTEAAVTAFENYLPLLLRQNHQECGASSSVPVVDLIVATDGSWKGYEVEQFMSWIGGALEIESQRSAIGLLHGNNGQWIAPLAHNLTSLFTTITNSTVEWPNRLNLPNVLSRIIQYSRNETLQQITDKKSASHNTVVLIISPTDQPSVDDLERARVLMNSLRSTFFDIYFAYVAQDMSTFQNINNAYMDYSEMFLTVNSNSVKDVIDSVDENLVKSIIPSRIFGAQCPVNGTEFYQLPYEDYVLPGREQQYRIHPFYLKQQPIVHVQFRNDGQGQILVCMWRGAEVSRSCHIINERDIYIFNLTDPCPSPEFCTPAHFAVAAMKTQNLCAHNECRLPHQVGYYLQHSGFRCLPLLGAAATLTPYWKVYVGLSLMISLLYLH